MLPAVRFHPLAEIVGPPGLPEIGHGLAVDREEAAGGPVLRSHVGDRRPVGDAQPVGAGTEVLDEAVDHTDRPQQFGDRKDQVGRGGGRRELADEPHPHDLRHQHEVGLTEHDGLGLDAAHPPAEHAQAVDHRGVRVGADDGVGVGPGNRRRTLGASPGRASGSGAGRGAGDSRRLPTHHLGQVLQVDLMADACPGREHPQVVEFALSPAQQGIALAVALHLHVHVQAAGVGHPGAVHLHRVIDHQIHGDARVDDGRVSPGARHRRTERRKVHHAGHAGEVLQQHSGRHEGELGALGSGGIPGEEGQHVLVVHDALSAVAQAVLEQHPDGVGQPVEVPSGRPGQLAQACHPGNAAGQLDDLPGPERPGFTAAGRRVGCNHAHRPALAALTFIAVTHYLSR